MPEKKRNRNHSHDLKIHFVRKLTGGKKKESIECTYEIGRRNFIIVTKRIEEHSDWKLSMFRTEGTTGAQFRRETVNGRHWFESTVQSRFLEAA